MNTDSLKEFQKRVQAIKKYQERLGKINIESLEANDEVYEVLEKITEVLKSNIDNEEKVRKMQDIINDEQRFVGFYAYQLTLEGLVLMRLISVMHVELETRYSEYIIKNNLTEWLKGIEKTAIAAEERFEHNEKYFSCYKNLDGKEIYKDVLEQLIKKNM